MCFGNYQQALRFPGAQVWPQVHPWLHWHPQQNNKWRRAGREVMEVSQCLMWQFLLLRVTVCASPNKPGAINPFIGNHTSIHWTILSDAESQWVTLDASNTLTHTETHTRVHTHMIRFSYTCQCSWTSLPLFHWADTGHVWLRREEWFTCTHLTKAHPLERIKAPSGGKWQPEAAEEPWEQQRNPSSTSRESRAPWGTVVMEPAVFSAAGRIPTFGSACRPSASSGRSPWSSSLGSSSATTRSPAAAGQSSGGWTTSAATLRMTSTSDIPVSTAEEFTQCSILCIWWCSHCFSQLAEKKHWVIIKDKRKKL